MRKSILLIFVFLLSACASFDKTNIRPGQRVDGLGFSFAPPTEKAWYASVYGGGNQIKLNQLNFDDSYSILIAINRGPRWGMYKSASQHLDRFQSHRRGTPPATGFIEQTHDEWIDPRFGKLCVRHYVMGEDWAGRNNDGPAVVETEGLVCPHKSLRNVLISVELSRRYETYAEKVELRPYADELFMSLEYESLD